MRLPGLRRSVKTGKLPINVASERLSHAEAAMTLDVDAHVLPAMDREAAAAIGALVWAGQSSAAPDEAPRTGE